MRSAEYIPYRMAGIDSFQQSGEKTSLPNRRTRRRTFVGCQKRLAVSGSCGVSDV